MTQSARAPSRGSGRREYIKSMKLSLCMIVKDEEAVLGRCLASAAAIADEIVVADTGSTDATKDVARRFSARVFDCAWTDDFSAARNFSFEQATGDYLLWLDADDIIPSDMVPAFLTLKERICETNADMVVCKYVSGDLCYFRERIVKRGAFRWQGRVHECIAPHGKVLRSDACVLHAGSAKERGARNLHIYQKWRAEETLSPRDLFYYGRELCYNRLYAEAEGVLEEMLAGDGWYVNKIEACRVLSDCCAAQGKREQAIGALLRSFLYGVPRGGVCHALGRRFQEAGRLREAVYWYERALTCPDFSPEGDFDIPNERTLFPLLGLTFCLDKLGEHEQARACHERAAALAPAHSSVVHNAAYFAQQKSPQDAGVS